jgi:hypothetical protein
MAESLDSIDRQRAASRCEYCRLPESESRLRHVLDHVVARQHGRRTDAQNLALCCGRCNQFKGPNLAGLNPQTGQMSHLFHPRIDRWAEHFRYDGAVLVGLTPVGRATVTVLAINLPIRVAAREALIRLGVSF